MQSPLVRPFCRVRVRLWLEQDAIYYSCDLVNEEALQTQASAFVSVKEEPLNNPAGINYVCLYLVSDKQYS